MIALIFDTETTALVSNRTLRLDKQLNVIEFYGALVDLSNGGQVMSDFATLIQPPRPLPKPEDLQYAPKQRGKKQKTPTEITGITNEMLVGAPDFAAVANTVRRCIESAPLVISHNLSFDKDALEIEYERLGQTLTWPPGICTVEATVHLKGFRLGLEDLYEYLFNEKITDHHRAQVDTENLIACCVEMHRREML